MREWPFFLGTADFDLFHPGGELIKTPKDKLYYFAAQVADWPSPDKKSFSLKKKIGMNDLCAWMYVLQLNIYPAGFCALPKNNGGTNPWKMWCYHASEQPVAWLDIGRLLSSLGQVSGVSRWHFQGSGKGNFVWDATEGNRPLTSIYTYVFQIGPCPAVSH